MHEKNKLFFLFTPITRFSFCEHFTNLISIRMEEVFYEKLELRKESRLNNLEQLAQAMNDAGNEFGPALHMVNALLKTAQAEFRLGKGERNFIINSCASNTLLPVRFLEGGMKTIHLNTKRLDLDAAKSRLRKTKSGEAQGNLGSSFWSEQAEADLCVVQAEFDKQAEIMKLLLEGIQTAHNSHLKCLRDFVESQMSFYVLAYQHMADIIYQHIIYYSENFLGDLFNRKFVFWLFLLAAAAS
uniref:BAR domain-containing protein n=1 Tax=Wuchereria bancrofti TaxID=6293 RepID=A0AAF5PKY8_WUCBA